jgi:hypothetical protein
MRKATLILLATALVLGLAIGSAQAAKKISTKVEVEWYDFDDGYFFFGDVHSKKNKCERNRHVTLEVGGDTLGTDKTDGTGDWVIPADLDTNAPFVATVKKRAIGNGEKKVVCKAAESEPLVVEP